MGVPNFWTHVKNNYSNGKIAINYDLSYFPFETKKKYDFLILDFHSLIYSTYSKFSQEINYFIRLTLLLKAGIIKLEDAISNEDGPIYRVIFDYIKTEYRHYFYLLEIDKLEIDKLEIIYDKIMSGEFKNQEIIIKSLSRFVIKLVNEMSEHHVIGFKPYNNTYIYFDGIPSISKIKEQLIRRVFPLISAEVKKNIFSTNSESWNEVLNCMLPEAPPSISLGSPIIEILRKYFQEFKNAKGKFNVNDVGRYGEAEHQIMSDLNTMEIFKNKKILLASPDGDLILLSMINFTKNIKFDIIRVNSEPEDREFKKYIAKGKYISKYKYVYDYIFIEEFCKSFGLFENGDFLHQKIIEFSYLLLLLGDDFIPIIPSININSIDKIWEIYNLLYATGSKIIEFNEEKKIYILNYENLYNYFNELSSFEKDMNDIKINDCKDKNKKKIGNINNNFKNIAKIYNLNKFKLSGILSDDDNENFKKNYYFNEGIIGDNYNTNLLFCNDSTTHQASDEQIISYLKGCKFVFELYFNNRIENYKWYYEYENAPTLVQIATFLKEKKENLDNLFINVDFTMQKYFDLVNYKKYILDNSNSILINFMKKICIIKNIDKLGELDELVRTKFSDTSKFDNLKKELFTYENIISISHCPNKQRYNKCFEPEKLLEPTIYFPESTINMSLLGGKNKYKYEKYISKIKKL